MEVPACAGMTVLVVWCFLALRSDNVCPGFTAHLTLREPRPRGECVSKSIAADTLKHRRLLYQCGVGFKYLTIATDLEFDPSARLLSRDHKH